MNIHEYQAKELLRPFGPVLAKGGVAFTPDEAVKAAEAIGGPLWVVKSQIHAGGRGKGKFKEAAAGTAGGVRLVQVARRGPRGCKSHARPHAGDDPDRRCRPRRQAPLCRGRHGHRARTLSLGAGRSRHQPHLLHRLDRRRHGHREGRPRHAREDHHRVDRSGRRLPALPRPQDRQGVRLDGRPEQAVRDA